MPLPAPIVGGGHRRTLGVGASSSRWPSCLGVRSAEPAAGAVAAPLLVAFIPAIARGAFDSIGRRVTRPWVAPDRRPSRRAGAAAGRQPDLRGAALATPGPCAVLAAPRREAAPTIRRRRSSPAFRSTTRRANVRLAGAAALPGRREAAAAVHARLFGGVGSPGTSIAPASRRRGRWEAGAAARRRGRGAADGAGLPPGIAAFDYAPHSLVMPRAAVTVHQGGVGTTGQALRAGRPMLVMPFGQDQPDNARRSCAARRGAHDLPSCLQPARVARELSALLVDPSTPSAPPAVGAEVARRARHR